MTTEQTEIPSQPRPIGSSKVTPIGKLTDLLTRMMGSVRVTNPIAREKPALAIAEMAKVCSAFPIATTIAVIDQIKFGGDAVWPTAGEMAVMLRDQHAKAGKADDRPMSTAARPRAPNANINGWNYSQIINHTKQGRRAKAIGKPHRFLMGLATGEIDLPPEMADPYEPQ